MIRQLAIRLHSLFRRAALRARARRGARVPHRHARPSSTSGGGMPPGAARRAALQQLRRRRPGQGRRPRHLAVATRRRRSRRTSATACAASAAIPASRWSSSSTMALGIGANTAIFSVVNGVLLRPLPYATASGSSSCTSSAARRRRRHRLLRQGNPRLPRRAPAARAASSSSTTCGSSCSDGREPERVATGVVSANFFDVLGVHAAATAARFGPSRRQPGAPAVLVLSHKYWQRSFGGDPAVVGRVFRMNDRPHTGHRRPAAGAAVSARGRRLHADLGLPVPIDRRTSPRRGSTAW